ncbi:MAG TPA: hypothetical protein PLM63_00415 [bacterium]|nr:hypothetical protein [Patescibacteria group bacterium]HOC96429.1 hypothetical protein [bacterium]HPO11039.1 hypothetical protein [bacterium]
MSITYIPLHLLMSKASLTCDFLKNRIKDEVDSFYGKGSSDNPDLKIGLDFLQQLEYILYSESPNTINKKSNTIKIREKYQIEKFSNDIGKIIDSMEK